MTCVLIADDVDVSRRRLSIILSRQGYKTLEAGDGDEALRLTKSECPDVAIIDLLMPEMDGFEFVRAVRNDPEVAETPVIFFSSNFETEDAIPLRFLFGVRHVLEKPCSIDQILRDRRVHVQPDAADRRRGGSGISSGALPRDRLKAR